MSKMIKLKDRAELAYSFPTGRVVYRGGVEYKLEEVPENRRHFFVFTDGKAIPVEKRNPQKVIKELADKKKGGK